MIILFVLFCFELIFLGEVIEHQTQDEQLTPGGTTCAKGVVTFAEDLSSHQVIGFEQNSKTGLIQVVGCDQR